ncbi:MAG: hypothetical protein ACOCV2_07040 [Persicimonas sp.]
MTGFFGVLVVAAGARRAHQTSSLLECQAVEKMRYFFVFSSCFFFLGSV